MTPRKMPKKTEKRWAYLRTNSNGAKEYSCVHGQGHGGVHGCDGCCGAPDFPGNKMPKKTRDVLKEIAKDEPLGGIHPTWAPTPPHVCPTKIEYVDREVIVYKPMPTWSIHAFWFFFSIIVGAVVWAYMYPNWTK